MSKVDDLITDVMKAEGWDKYTNHPADKGGPTKWGITLEAWSDYVGQEMTPADVQAITETGAREFYLKKHFLAPGFDKLPVAIQDTVVDAGVHSGTRAAAKWVQRAVGVKQDGDVGPNTCAAAFKLPPEAIELRILAYRLALFGRLVSQDPELLEVKKAGFRLQAEFAAGWNNRVVKQLLAIADQL